MQNKCELKSRVKFVLKVLLVGNVITKQRVDTYSNTLPEYRNLFFHVLDFCEVDLAVKRN